jgi:hypothetical protein
VNPKRLPSPPYNPGVRDLIRAKRAGSRPLRQEDRERGFVGWHENGYLRTETNRVLFNLLRFG